MFNWCEWGISVVIRPEVGIRKGLGLFQYW